MEDLSNLFKNFVAKELEGRGIGTLGPSVSQEQEATTGVPATGGPPLPSDDNFYAAQPPSQSDESQSADESSQNTQVVEAPPLESPDSSTFSIEQTLIQPTLTSDVATVSVIISLNDIAGADNYEVRWVTA